MSESEARRELIDAIVNNDIEEVRHLVSTKPTLVQIEVHEDDEEDEDENQDENENEDDGNEGEEEGEQDAMEIEEGDDAEANANDDQPGDQADASPTGTPLEVCAVLGRTEIAHMLIDDFGAALSPSLREVVLAVQFNRSDTLRLFLQQNFVLTKSHRIQLTKTALMEGFINILDILWEHSAIDLTSVTAFTAAHVKNNYNPPFGLMQATEQNCSAASAAYVQSTLRHPTVRLHLTVVSWLVEHNLLNPASVKVFSDQSRAHPSTEPLSLLCSVYGIDPWYQTPWDIRKLTQLRTANMTPEALQLMADRLWNGITLGDVPFFIAEFAQAARDWRAWFPIRDHLTSIIHTSLSMYPLLLTLHTFFGSTIIDVLRMNHAWELLPELMPYLERLVAAELSGVTPDAMSKSIVEASHCVIDDPCWLTYRPFHSATKWQDMLMHSPYPVLITACLKGDYPAILAAYQRYLAQPPQQSSGVHKAWDEEWIQAPWVTVCTSACIALMHGRHFIELQQFLSTCMSEITPTELRTDENLKTVFAACHDDAVARQDIESLTFVDHVMVRTLSPAMLATLEAAFRSTLDCLADKTIVHIPFVQYLLSPERAATVWKPKLMDIHESIANYQHVQHFTDNKVDCLRVLVDYLATTFGTEEAWKISNSLRLAAITSGSIAACQVLHDYSALLPRPQPDDSCPISVFHCACRVGQAQVVETLIEEAWAVGGRALCRRLLTEKDAETHLLTGCGVAEVYGQADVMRRLQELEMQLD